MQIRTVFLINVIVAGILGLGYFFVPQQTTAPLGLSLDAAGVAVARVAGAFLIGYAIISWFVRELSDADLKRAVLPGYVGGYLFTFLASLWGQLSGVLNALGWINVVISLLFLLAYAYFLFMGGARNKA